MSFCTKLPPTPEMEFCERSKNLLPPLLKQAILEDLRENDRADAESGLRFIHYHSGIHTCSIGAKELSGYFR